jgi:hypothetical protein
MAKKDHGKELSQLEQYINSTDNEDAKRPLLYPIFSKVFGNKMKIESAANGADVYIEGQLLVESKSTESQWVEGFYQALHYQKKYGLSYNTIIVIAHEFVGIWKLKKLPEEATKLAHLASALKAPNVIGKENAKLTKPFHRSEIKDAALLWYDSKSSKGDLFSKSVDVYYITYEILKVLNNLDSDRLMINPSNFINTIERMKKFFEQPIDAVHAFYTIVAYWDISSTIAETNVNPGEIKVIGFKGNQFSDSLFVSPRLVNEFKHFLETQYVFTNEGSGLTVDYYFSRFDEVLAKIDPEYVKQHGIFFTDSNLSKFALWFAKNHFPGNINDDYIVFDPAGGSGNLVSSWRGKLKHKIVSELQPDLLRTIERRMKADPYHIDHGFTIIPKTSSNKGLNFLDISAEEYYNELCNELKLKNIALDKPLAFLLNPPYKNNKENENLRSNADANYGLHKSIIEIGGEDAANERYLAFLSQIINISKVQYLNKLKPIVLVFTPTSWLIPRPSFINFRKVWDANFKFETGFIITSNEFFKLEGKWPLAFTIWTFDENIDRTNEINIIDLTSLNRESLGGINWNSTEEKTINNELSKFIKKSSLISYSKKNKSLREANNLKLYDFIRTPTKTEKESKNIIGGLPLKDERRNNNKTYGTPESNFIGFLDNCTPARIKPRGDLRRFSENNLQTVWFRVDTAIKDINKSKCFSGPADNRSYCASDIESAKSTFTWFSITKVLNGNYPIWANQFDIWAPVIKPAFEYEWYSLCFAFVLAENRCVVTKFEKDNPVLGAPEVFIDNPICPTHKDNFYTNVLAPFLNESKTESSSKDLINEVIKLYKLWNTNYCKGQYLFNIGLQNEPYFKYFDYADFLTPHSGLIQIRKYAEIHADADLLNQFGVIAKHVKHVKARMYELLVEDFGYFE